MDYEMQRAAKASYASVRASQDNIERNDKVPVAETSVRSHPIPCTAQDPHGHMLKTHCASRLFAEIKLPGPRMWKLHLASAAS